ncbi:hypothetical protein BDV18DRAFT_130081 [Aspergillus unguis]
MNVKGDHANDAAEDSDDSTYSNTIANRPQRVRVEYKPELESDPTSDSEIESDNQVDFDINIDPLDTRVPTSVSRPRAPRQRKRLVSWDGVKEEARPRWTMEQEKKLVHARAELARCQKAWSSEQEVWIERVERLSEEKEAHEGFMNNRAKHIGDEQTHFRKACNRNRRRSEQDQLQEQPQSARLTRTDRTGSLPVRLGMLRGRNSTGDP